jgi:hypothetical protein
LNGTGPDKAPANVGVSTSEISQTGNRLISRKDRNEKATETGGFFHVRSGKDELSATTRHIYP